jgi:hypothetical protein
LLWLPDNLRMLPQTLEKLRELIRDGATVVGNAPAELATLSGGVAARQRFDTAVREIWEDPASAGIRNVGKGTVVSGMSFDSAMQKLAVSPDVIGEGALWLHRKTEKADWYFVCAPQGKGFRGVLSFRNNGNVEIWNPVNGEIVSTAVKQDGKRTMALLDLPEAGSCFVVFRHTGKPVSTIEQISEEETSLLATAILPNTSWTLAFSPGWGAPATVRTTALKAWKDLDVSEEAKAYSGTVRYATTFNLNEWKDDMRLMLDLGRVEMIADVSVNGKRIGTLWAPPYRMDVSGAVRQGENTLTADVTGTWFNRLVYDAAQPEASRKTWTISGPSKDARPVESGLLGPVVLRVGRKMYF